MSLLRINQSLISKVDQDIREVASVYICATPSCLYVEFMLERDFGIVWMFGVVRYSEVLEVVRCSDGL